MGARSLHQGQGSKWERNAKLLPFLRNIAGQAYDVSKARVVNYGEVLGRHLFFSAEGSFSEVDAAVRSCPKDYDVQIDGGGITLLGTKLRPPIKGPGYLRVLYADEGLRIFVSPKESPGRWEEE